MGDPKTSLLIFAVCPGPLLAGVGLERGCVRPCTGRRCQTNCYQHDMGYTMRRRGQSPSLTSIRMGTTDEAQIPKSIDTVFLMMCGVFGWYFFSRGCGAGFFVFDPSHHFIWYYSLSRIFFEKSDFQPDYDQHERRWNHLGHNIRPMRNRFQHRHLHVSGPFVSTVGVTGGGAPYGPNVQQAAKRRMFENLQSATHTTYCSRCYLGIKPQTDTNFPLYQQLFARKQKNPNHLVILPRIARRLVSPNAHLNTPPPPLFRYISTCRLPHHRLQGTFKQRG